MDTDVVNTFRLIEIILRALEDIIIPAVALWIAYQIRRWLKGELVVPPYEHRVELKSDVQNPP